MNDERHLRRSPELMSADDTALLVVDVQERLLPAIADHQRLLFNAGRLVDGARILEMPVVATEQYPKGLGPTVPPLSEKLGDDLPSKLTFSCSGCPEIFRGLIDQGIRKILVVGIEAHVCVQQTVLDLLGDGWRVYVAVDAIGSRHRIDYEIALRRMDSSGAVLTTTEAALFEWCEAAGTPKFKEISRLVQMAGP